jgi:hypothetical protein
MDQNLIFLASAYDFRGNSIPVSITWINFSFMLPITLTFSDVIPFNDTVPLRETRLSVQGSYRIPLGNERRALTLSGILNSYWLYSNSHDGGDNTISRSLQSVQGSIRISNIIRNSWERFGNGISEQLNTKKLLIEDNDFRFENLVTGSIESIPALQNVPAARDFAFYGAFYGAYDKNGIINHYGHSSYYSSSLFEPVSAYEYNTALYRNTYSWIIGGEFDFSPVSVEIQKNFSHLYFNRVYASTGYRWAYLNPKDRLKPSSSDIESLPLLHSVIFRLSNVVSIVPLTVLPIKITVDLFGALKLSLLKNGFSSDDVYLGFGLSASY